MGAKIITKVTSDDEANSILRPIKLSDINPDDETHESFFSETLTIFHQILYITTVDIWKAHTERNKLTSAALNLKTKRKSLEVFNITASTATAIAKAQDNINETQTQNLNSSLRITNLEKSFRKQEQKTGKLVKSIQTKNTPKQKNLKGRYKMGSVTSPDYMAPTINKSKNKNKNNNNHQQKIIDLSEDGIEDSVCSAHEENNNTLSPAQAAKRSNLFPYPAMKKGKMVHWNEANLATHNTQNLAYQQPFHMLPAHSMPMQHSYPHGPALLPTYPPTFSPNTLQHRHLIATNATSNPPISTIPWSESLQPMALPPMAPTPMECDIKPLRQPNDQKECLHERKPVRNHKTLDLSPKSGSKSRRLAQRRKIRLLKAK
jgi:hypothetical protein